MSEPGRAAGPSPNSPARRLPIPACGLLSGPLPTARLTPCCPLPAYLAVWLAGVRLPGSGFRRPRWPEADSFWEPVSGLHDFTGTSWERGVGTARRRGCLCSARKGFRSVRERGACQAPCLKIPLDFESVQHARAVDFRRQ